MEQVSIALLSFLQNFCVVLVAFELLLCRHLPKRSHFPLRLLAVAAFIFIFCKEIIEFIICRRTKSRWILMYDGFISFILSTILIFTIIPVS